MTEANWYETEKCVLLKKIIVSSKHVAIATNSPSQKPVTVVYICRFHVQSNNPLSF